MVCVNTETTFNEPQWKYQTT